MNKTTLFIAYMLLASSFTYCQTGWRDKEMEIKVTFQNAAEKNILYSLKLNGDVYATYGLMYAVPQELSKLKSSGLQFEIIKSDLNEHYKGFWLKQEQNYQTAVLADKYHTYDEVIALIDSLATSFPAICKKVSLGTSIGSRQLCALKISDNVNTDENEPEVLFDGGIHGDEIGGAENTIRFSRHLCLGYNKNATITDLINNREIWIYPMVNPDGRVNVTRYNNNNIDLNRDLGYMWNAEGGSKSPYSQTETKALRNLMYNKHFVIHLNCHSGSQNVFYPWCHRSANSPDNANFNFLASRYAGSSLYSSLVYTQSNADYPTTGEVDDCSYGINGTMAMVLEISVNKQPNVTEMINYYNYNVPAMLMLLQYSGYGIEGKITDSTTGKPVAAAIYADNFYPVYSDSAVGDFHKYLLPGNHSIKVIANGYKPKIFQNISVADKQATITDVKLQPLKKYYAYKVVSANIPGNNPADKGNTPAVIGAPDNVFYSMGKGGTLILDMQYPIINATGNDIRIYEGDTTPEGYTCYIAETMDGPWKLIGTGTGTTDFDIASTSLIKAQFIKLIDDNDGVAASNAAGFDLDAIEVLSATTGVSVINAGVHFTLFPNPASSLLTITTQIENGQAKGEEYTISVKNILGQEVFSGRFNRTLTIDISNFLKGLYVAEVRKSAGEVCHFEKIIVN